MRPDDIDEVVPVISEANKGGELAPSILEVRVDPDYESCDQCIHADDDTNLCVLRQCVHALSPVECFRKKKGGANDGTDQPRGSL